MNIYKSQKQAHFFLSCVCDMRLRLTYSLENLQENYSWEIFVINFFFGLAFCFDFFFNEK